MAATVYILGALTSLACAIMLLRGYMRSQVKLLMWSGISFIFLSLNNAILFIDLIVLPEIDFLLVRNGLVLVSLIIILYGLIWDTRG